jgi:hypothetical protein
MLDKVKPAAIGARPASVFVNFWQRDGAEDSPGQFPRQAIRADGTERHGLSVAAFKCEPTPHWPQEARSKTETARDSTSANDSPELNDEIPPF